MNFKNNKLYILLFAAAMAFSCNKPAQNDKNEKHSRQASENRTENISKANKNTTAEILAKHQIPVLCYHRITNEVKSDYAVTPETFNAHMKMLADSGYHSILPDQLYDYLVFNKALPEKPFLITFDDSRAEHIGIAAPAMEKFGFRGTFFIMTITYNKKNYMTTDQIAQLAKAGHTIGLHSWDHTMATKYKEDADWQKQVEAPKKKLETIIGRNVDYWAYPNGVSNHESAAKLDKYFKLSFILSTKRDSLLPLQTVRRIIVPDYSAQRLLKSMRESFK
ncbi:MAG TPA: polysaccharide deacetylase family protein [Paludibacter sp.]|nr:polysaccharide deacetylase family protein [Paludibacter sp.]